MRAWTGVRIARCELPRGPERSGSRLNRFSTADPSDRGTLGVVGFHIVTPQLGSDFARGSP
jgi:hypothetical protein